MHPEINCRHRQTLEQIDAWRAELDAALARNDRVAALRFIDQIQDLAKKADALTETFEASPISFECKSLTDAFKG